MERHCGQTPNVVAKSSGSYPMMLILRRTEMLIQNLCFVILDLDEDALCEDSKKTRPGCERTAVRSHPGPRSTKGPRTPSGYSSGLASTRRAALGPSADWTIQARRRTAKRARIGGWVAECWSFWISGPTRPLR